MSEKLRILIVDDERPARERIRELLAAADVEIVAESKNGLEALEKIREMKPALVFLDIQMPGMDGFAVLQALKPAELPVIIFVTAFDQYAIRAFDVNAIDYLLKPFSDERFDAALAKARRQCEQNDQEDNDRQRLLDLLDGLQASGEGERQRLPLDRLAVKTSDRILLLKTEEIDWIEAAGVYVNLHIGRRSYLYRETIGALAVQLDARQFIRIHRSTIVNIDRIRELQPRAPGEYYVILQDNSALKLSRGYRSNLRKRLGKPF